jgi:hypothetical protein
VHAKSDAFSRCLFLLCKKVRFTEQCLAVDQGLWARRLDATSAAFFVAASPHAPHVLNQLIRYVHINVPAASRT